MFQAKTGDNCGSYIVIPDVAKVPLAINSSGSLPKRDIGITALPTTFGFAAEYTVKSVGKLDPNLGGLIKFLINQPQTVGSLF